jgi:hypothetical protein
MVEWKGVAREFEWDGSLRDIYVLGTGHREWDRFLELCRAGPFALRFEVDGVSKPLPRKAAEIFSKRSEISPLLQIDVGGVRANCHFFTVCEIELDIDPREVNSETFRSLLTFLCRLGDELGCDVVLTPENVPSLPILRYVHERARVELVQTEETSS